MPETLTLGKIKRFFKARKKGSHKGENGRVLIIGGSEGLAGAPALAAMAALRSGIDLCTVAAPEKVGWAVQKWAPDLIVKKLPGKNLGMGHLKYLLKLAEKADAALIGIGMGRGNGAMRMARNFVRSAKCKVVLDADALRACKGMTLPNGALVAPHAKEFEIFTGKKVLGKGILEKIATVKYAARRQNCTILLKGPVDIIADGKKVLLNKTGNAGMTRGGTGDVLAGICSAYIALGASPLNAAGAAAFVNGRIGEALKGKIGYAFIASDFIREAPKWTKKILK